MSQVATLLGGKILVLPPFLGNGQLHNYLTIFLIASLVSFSSIIWVVYMINQEKEKVKFYAAFGPKQQDVELQNMTVTSQNGKVNDNQINEKIKNEEKQKNPIQMLFDLNNVVEMFTTCLKKRDNHVRAQIWLLFLSMIIYLLSHSGPYVFLFQFVQRVYDWNAEIYSYAYALSNFFQSVALLTVVPYLVKVLT